MDCFLFVIYSMICEVLILFVVHQCPKDYAWLYVYFQSHF